MLRFTPTPIKYTNIQKNKIMTLTDKNMRIQRKAPLLQVFFFFSFQYSQSLKAQSYGKTKYKGESSFLAEKTVFNHDCIILDITKTS